MLVTFWGVRGSIATSGSEFSRYGGNTTCLEITCGDKQLIFDAGTGLRALGQKMLVEGRKETTFFFSHLHWDHIQGFPFFSPAFVPGTKIELYGPVDEDGVTTLHAALDAQMKPPCFPVTLDMMASEKHFTTVASGDVISTGPFDVSMRALNHPQGSLGFRIEAGGRSVCFATDTEHKDEEIDDAILDLARDVDLLIYDAQYTEDEYEGRAGPSRRGWGHSTYVAATEIAHAAGAKQLALFHHDPTHDDAMVERMESDARTRFVNAFAAREGLTLDV
ncbi:MAG: MBL fold metallo-hydrolase [Deltaproteobacteria bacterium]